MKNIRINFSAFALISLSFLLPSCEGFHVARGTVVDASSRKPLAGVLCEAINGGSAQTTDSTGRFEVTGPFGGCLPNCPEITMRFSKDSYKVYQVANPAYDTIILLEAE